MKKITSLLLVIASATLWSNGQIFSKERILNRTENEAQERVDEKINNGIEKGFDAVEGMFSGKNRGDDNHSESDQEYTPRENQFIGQITMTVESYKKDKLQEDESTTIKYAFDQWKTAMTMSTSEDGDMRIIYELKEGTMVTLMEQGGQKQGIRMKIPQVDMDWVVEDTEELNTDVTITETDEYRQISGYNCRLYIVKQDGISSEMWMTTEISLDFFAMMETLSLAGFSNGGVSGMQQSQIIEGFPIQIVSTEGNEKFVMTFSDIREGSFDSAMFSTTGYAIMGF